MLRPALQSVTPDVASYRTGVVNVYFVGAPGADRWVLVDTGLPGFASRIVKAAAQRYGSTPPTAIVLTHGHSDHVGNAQALSDRWNVPIYAHPLELPHLTGYRKYAPKDPFVGGLFALTSPLLGRGPVDLGNRVRALPADHTVPGMDGWRWLHTPGHTDGHTSLFRDADRTLLAGDAFVTTKMETLHTAIPQTPGVYGPPQFATPDWFAARESVAQLAALEPEAAGTGHGLPYHGRLLRDELHRLARTFDTVAVPARGRTTPVQLRRPAPLAGRLGWGLAAAALAGVAAGAALETRR